MRCERGLRAWDRSPQREGRRGGELKLRILPSPEAAAAHAASLIAAAARQTVDASGSFTFALSGGRTPWLMCAELARHEVPWEHTWIFQVDERIAPEGDPARNLTHLRESLPEPALERLVPMPIAADGDVGASEEGAIAYGGRLPPSLDLVHLGLGADGHTASLVPEDPVLAVSDMLVGVTARPYQGHRRMTLTYPALTAARSILWLVTGGEKRDPLTRLMSGDRRIPAGAVRASAAVIIADESAAAGVRGRRAGRER